MIDSRTFPIRTGLAAFLLIITSAAGAADCPDGIESLTVADPGVTTQILSHRVMPLTRCELEAEAAAWLEVLKDKVREVSDAEVAALARNGDGQSAPAADAGTVEAGRSTEAVDDPRTDSSRRIADLTSERNAIIDRFQVILDELESKGGDPAEYVAYIKAVSGIKVDVTDASAAWTSFTDWLLSAEGGIRWAINFVKFIVIIAVFFVLSILAAGATERALRRSKKTTVLLRDFLIMIARRTVLIIGFFVGLSALEINVGPVLAVIGAAGFVIAFALQSSLSNFASGILMLVYRPFDIDDFVNVGGVSGKVESMNLLSTQLRTPDNQLMVVPNNAVWGDVITNVTGISRRRVDLVFGIGYGDDIDKAQRILEDIVADQPQVLDDPAPVIKLHELADSSVNFVCRPWVKPADYWEVYWNITREVKKRFDAEGVSIPFPQRDVHVYNEDAAAS